MQVPSPPTAKIYSKTAILKYLHEMPQKDLSVSGLSL